MSVKDADSIALAGYALRVATASRWSNDRAQRAFKRFVEEATGRNPQAHFRGVARNSTARFRPPKS
jgi:hypothetical protein